MKTHQTCPKCGHNDCFTVYENGGYCHSTCGWLPNKKERTMEFQRDTSKEKYTTFRGIPASVNKFYGITTGMDDKGDPEYRVYPYPHMNKIRVLPKNFRHNSGFSNSRLFGIDKFNVGTSRHITIVEGEEDAPSAYYMLGEKYPVVALPGASISDKLLEEEYDNLNAFEEIIICTDGDAAGDAAANKLTSVFPGKVSRVPLTKYKDPNDFLQNGAQKDFLFAWVNRKKYVPAGIYNTVDQFMEIMQSDEVNEYIPTPFTALNDKIKGLIRGHLHVLTGPEGQGKTEVLRAFEYHILKEYPDVNIGVLHMEESKKMCLTTYACYEMDKDVRDPDTPVPQADIDAAVEKLTANGNLYLMDFEDEDPFAIFDKVRYLANVSGCHYIFIDPIQQLAYGKERDLTEEQVLSKVSVRLEKMANDLNVGIIISAHVNDDGQTRSSRMIGKSASIRIDLTRDHLNEDEDVKNTTYLSVSKNRPLAKTGYGGTLKFDPATFKIGEWT